MSVGRWGHQLEQRLKRVDDLIHGIERRDPSLRVRMFVASDVPEGVTLVQRRWGDRVLSLREKISFHTALDTKFKPSVSQRRGLIKDLMADWFVMALADILYQPGYSTLSGTASRLGLQGPCAFINPRYTPDTFSQPLGKCVEAVTQAMSQSIAHAPAPPPAEAVPLQAAGMGTPMDELMMSSATRSPRVPTWLVFVLVACITSLVIPHNAWSSLGLARTPVRPNFTELNLK